MSSAETPGMDDALALLSRQIPELVHCLALADTPDMATWRAVIDGKLRPRLHPDLPLLAAICGGGSSGKSSLFNALVGRNISPVGGRAGINRRVLLAGGPAYLARRELLSAGFTPFGCTPEPLRDPAELTVPGGPLCVATDRLPPGLAVMDTPDFDTGAKGDYTNREAARQSLEVADIIIYIFTNSNYSNLDNTDFIARMLTQIGERKCFLVYRVYPSFSQEEVLEHAGTVARNIYGDDARRCVLGVYRADEDNAVAAGQRLMKLGPARSGEPLFADALAALDTQALRLELNASILEDAAAWAAGITARAGLSVAGINLYRDALQILQEQSTRNALRHFPMDQVLGRFAEIWEATDPPHIRFMRRTGSVIEWPVKTLTGFLRRGRSETGAESSRSRPEAYAAAVREDLVDAAQRLHAGAAASTITVSLAAADPASARSANAVGRIRAGLQETDDVLPEIQPDAETGVHRLSVPAPPALAEDRTRLREKPWQATLQSILARRDVVLSLSESIEKELALRVERFRADMGFWDKLRQSFSAFLNVLPATAAVTYILHTGDPVGAAGIKVKLTGWLGLQDLYALIALPATSGLKKADRKQLEILLEPIARTWLTHKVKSVRELFEQEITGDLIAAAVRTADRATALMGQIEGHLARISRNRQHTGGNG